MRGTDTEAQGTKRYFVTYTGIKMPFKLVNELEPHEVQNRNTYFCGLFDGDRLLGFDKHAYGEIEMSHRYSYHDNGKLSGAEITDIDGETTLLVFDVAGNAA
jgi:YD repeat-containing protein